MNINNIIDKLIQNPASVQKELNKIGLCVVETSGNRTILCKIQNDKPALDNIILDYVFVEHNLDKLKKFIKSNTKPSDATLEYHVVSLNNEDILYKLYTEDSDLTLDECNKFIQETYAKSAKERVQRATRPIGSNRMNDNGRSRLNPSPNRRIADYSTNSSNDPSRTSRGRAMLRRQANKHGKKYNAAVEFINKNYGKQIDESLIQDKHILENLCLRLLRSPEWSGDNWIYDLHKRVSK